MLSELAQDWSEELHIKLPALEEPFLDEFERIWNNYIKELVSKMHSVHPDLGEEFEVGLPTLQPLKELFCSNVKAIMRSISKDAATYHQRILDDLEQSVRPIFEKALGVTGTSSPMTT